MWKQILADYKFGHFFLFKFLYKTNYTATTTLCSIVIPFPCIMILRMDGTPKILVLGETYTVHSTHSYRMEVYG